MPNQILDQKQYLSRQTRGGEIKFLKKLKKKKDSLQDEQGKERVNYSERRRKGLYG